MTRPCHIKISLHQPTTEEPIDIWVFEDKPHIKIGRAADNDVVLANSLVSRRHIELKYMFNTWKVESVGTNGTFIDGQQVLLGWVTVNGMEIRVGPSGPILKLWPQGLAQQSVVDIPDRLEEQTLYLQPVPDYR